MVVNRQGCQREEGWRNNEAIHSPKDRLKHKFSIPLHSLQIRTTVLLPDTVQWLTHPNPIQCHTYTCHRARALGLGLGLGLALTLTSSEVR